MAHSKTLTYAFPSSKSTPSTQSSGVKPHHAITKPQKPPLHLYLLSLLFLLSAAADELQILLKLKSSLQDSNAQLFATWNSTANSFCTFTGVTCNAAGEVREIELSNQKLSGSLPLDSICQLPSLESSLWGPIIARDDHGGLEELHEFEVPGFGE
ncbi:hypothetical protein M0R45_027113 [Rubus argutus]